MKASMCKRFLLFLVCIIRVLNSYGQQNNEHHVELKWDNDILNYRFAGTDRYYTNGAFINMLMPRKNSSFFLGRLFFNDSAKVRAFSEAGIYQLMFTPKNISTGEINSGDYPYGGLLSVYYSNIFNSLEKGLRITSSIHLATLGKFSLAEDLQKLIHRLNNYLPPQGWNNEVNKTLLFNYNLMIEKRIMHHNNNWLQIIPNATVRAGMINTSLSAGGTVQFGLKDDYFSYIKSYSLQSPSSKKNISVYFTFQPKLTYLIWNGILEPSVQKNIDTYKEAYQVNNAYPEVKRLLFDYSFSMYLGIKNVRLGITQSFLAKELSTTDKQEVGSISLAFKL